MKGKDNKKISFQYIPYYVHLPAKSRRNTNYTNYFNEVEVKY